MASATQNGRTTIPATAGVTVTSVVVNTAPHIGYSLHDCTSPDQASVMNAVYPYNSTTGGSKYPPTNVNMLFKNGVTIHTVAAHSVGNYTITYA
jgi:hypothetical protein